MKWTTALSNAAHIRRQISRIQTQQLFNIAATFNQEGATALDIGTFHGYSAAIIAQAIERGRVITLNPCEEELVVARKNLARWPNIEIVCARSWDYLATYEGPLLAFVFVDGHHNYVARDLEWWHKLEAGGLILFHDYNEPGGQRDSPVVRNVLDKIRLKLGRPFDIHCTDEEKGIGMVGIYRWKEHDT